MACYINLGNPPTLEGLFDTKNDLARVGCLIGEGWLSLFPLFKVKTTSAQISEIFKPNLEY